MKHTILVFLATLMTRAGGALGGMLLSLMIARIGGADGLGRFAVFLSLLGSFALLARHGTDMLLLRAVAWAQHHASPGTPIALLRHGMLRVFLPSLALGGMAAAILASGRLGEAFPGTITASTPALALVTFLALISGYAKGLGRAWIAPLFEIGGISMLTTFLLLLTLPLKGSEISLAFVTLALLAALLLLTAGAAWMIWRDMPTGGPLPHLTGDQQAELRTGRINFTLIALAVFLTQAGAFALAAFFLPETDLGLLRAAERLALLVAFPVFALDPVISPHIARLARSQNHAGLLALVAKAVAGSTIAAGLVLAPLLIWPEQALALMGADFVVAADKLRLLAATQFFLAMIGPMAITLNMSGRERVSMWINLAAFAAAIVLFPLMSQLWGASGFVGAYMLVALGRGGIIAIIGTRNLIRPKPVHI